MTMHDYTNLPDKEKGDIIKAAAKEANEDQKAMMRPSLDTVIEAELEKFENNYTKRGGKYDEKVYVRASAETIKSILRSAMTAAANAKVEEIRGKLTNILFCTEHNNSNLECSLCKTSRKINSSILQALDNVEKK